MTEITASAACGGPGRHVIACYGREVLPCPSCGTPMLQTVPLCAAVEPWAPLHCTTCSLACPDCPSEVRVTVAQRAYARVIHSATCPWYRAYQAGGPRGRIPCGVTVTHRGPYRRDPAPR